MNEERINDRRGGKLAIGLVVLTAGVLLLLDSLGVYFPPWLLTWPAGIMAVGLALLLTCRTHMLRGIIIFLVGLVNFLPEIDNHLNYQRFAFPVIIILLGLVVIFRRHRKRDDFFSRGAFNTAWKEEWGRAGRSAGVPDERTVSPAAFSTSGPAPASAAPSSEGPAAGSAPEILNEWAIFGRILRKVSSRYFGGGQIVSFFGGLEINFMNTDIQGRVILDCTQLFGGTKLIVPADWQVQSEIMVIFGEVEDKRAHTQGYDQTKILLLKGASMFGGVQILSYS